MSVQQIGITVGGNIQRFIGLTADTTSWLAANTNFGNGSTYRELDGAYRLYELLNGAWYLQ